MGNKSSRIKSEIHDVRMTPVQRFQSSTVSPISQPLPKAALPANKNTELSNHDATVENDTMLRMPEGCPVTHETEEIPDSYVTLFTQTRRMLPDQHFEPKQLESSTGEVISVQVPKDGDEHHELRKRCEKLEKKNWQQREEILRLNEEIEKIKTEKEELLMRLSDFTSKHLADNNPCITDLGDPNRPEKLVERFSELYDNEWTEVFDLLCQVSTTEENAIRELLRILQAIYTLCKKEAAKQLHQTALSIYGLTKMEADSGPIKRSMKEFKEERKRNYKDFIDDLRKQVEGMDDMCTLYVSETPTLSVSETPTLSVSETPTLSLSETPTLSVRENPTFKAFITKGIELCWLMCIQDPPLVLHFSGTVGNSFDETLFKAYTKAGKKIKYVVWPAVALYEGGQTLMKGVAQGKGKQKKKRSLGRLNSRNTDEESKRKSDKNVIPIIDDIGQIT